jgi:VWFA-related protein
MHAANNYERRVHRGTGEDARSSIISVLLIITMLCGGVSSQEPSTTEYTFRSKTELVLVNVTVRDKNGNPVRDLKREDFTLLEDNKPQQVLSFDLENTDAVLSTAATEAALLRPAQPAKTDAASALGTRPLKDRRLIILFFDLSSMQPDEIDQATTAAQNYVDKQMVPADLVSVVSLGSTLSVNQDFTSDRPLLKKALQAPAPPRGHPRLAVLSRRMTPSTTFSTPTAASRPCDR